MRSGLIASPGFPAATLSSTVARSAAALRRTWNLWRTQTPHTAPTRRSTTRIAKRGLKRRAAMLDSTKPGSATPEGSGSRQWGNGRRGTDSRTEGPEPGSVASTDEPGGATADRGPGEAIAIDRSTPTQQTIQAEGMGFEPTIHLWTSDFESDRWPIRLPSELPIQCRTRNGATQVRSSIRHIRQAPRRNRLVAPHSALLPRGPGRWPRGVDRPPPAK